MSCIVMRIIHEDARIGDRPSTARDVGGRTEEAMADVSEARS